MTLDDMKCKSKYNADTIAKALDYLYNCPDVVHSVVGLCVHIDVSKSTIYTWRQEGKEEISDILERVLQKQELKLISGGLTSEFNSVITKMMLTKHGYSDKIETDITSKGQSINNWTVNPVTTDTSNKNG